MPEQNLGHTGRMCRNPYSESFEDEIMLLHLFEMQERHKSSISETSPWTPSHYNPSRSGYTSAGSSCSVAPSLVSGNSIPTCLMSGNNAPLPLASANNVPPTLASANSVLDSLPRDMSQLLTDHSVPHEVAQSSSGPASLASNYPNLSHTKPCPDVHLTAPKVALGGSRSALTARQALGLCRPSPGPAATSTPSHLKHSQQEWIDLRPGTDDQMWAVNSILQQLNFPPFRDEGETPKKSAIVFTRFEKIRTTPGAIISRDRDSSPSPPRVPPVSQSSYSQVSRDPISSFSWTPPLMSSLHQAQREVGTSRHERDSTLGNLPEKEDHKQREDGRYSSDDRSKSS